MKNLRMWLRFGVVLTILFVAVGTIWLGLGRVADSADYIYRVYDCTPHFPDCYGNRSHALEDIDRQSIFYYAFLAMLIWAALGWVVAVISYFVGKWVVAAREK